MNSKQNNRWMLDLALFTGFLACFFLDLTGVGLHQWLGIAGGIVAGYHLVSHSSWVAAVTRRFFGKTSFQAKLYYAVDAVLLVGFLTIIGSGIVISTWLNLSLTSYAAWQALHVAASISTLITIVLKIAMHYKWIVSTARKTFKRQAVYPVRASIPENPAAGRREFLKVMGVVGAASFVAIGSTVNSLQSTQSGQSSSTTTAASESSSSDLLSIGRSLFSSVSGTSSSACSVQCGRRCSYPGHCRKYVDSNANGRCDLGECQA